MSNQLGQIYGTVKNAETYIVLNSENVELSGNVYINGGLAIDNSFGISGEVLISQGSTSSPKWASMGGITDVSNLDASSVSLIELSNNTLFYTPPITVFGSFKLSSNLSITNNAINDITSLTAQSGVTINGMSINSSTGIITLNTSGVYLMNIGFRVHQTTGAGGLYQSHIWLADGANNFLNSINEFIDQGGSDSYRTLTITGHLVIVASSNNYQVKLRMYQTSANTGISLIGGNVSQGVSIQRIS